MFHSCGVVRGLEKKIRGIALNNHLNLLISTAINSLALIDKIEYSAWGTQRFLNDLGMR